MIIESITLNNFRQYYKIQKIDFSISPTRNITVIHGENGSGKTALLNAFSWCLYGILNLPNEEKIINEHALSSASLGEMVEASVTLKYNHNNKFYTLTRSVKATAVEDGIHYFEPELKLEYREDGLSQIVNNPQIEVERTLPSDLRSYFFFDGERIDNLSKDSGTEDIKKAIKSIMGLEILERGINHTSSARKKFRSEMKKYGDTKTNIIIEEIERLENIEIEIQSDLELQKQNYNSLQKQIKDLEERLKTIEGAKQLQELRDIKNEEIKNVKKEINDIQKNILDLITKQGYLAFSFPAIIKAEQILKDRTSDKVITGISNNLIDNLIDQGKCICGTIIKEESSHYNHLVGIKELSNTTPLEQKIMDSLMHLGIIREKKEFIIKELKQLKTKEVSLIQILKKLNEEIEEIGLKLTEKDSEKISELEFKRQKMIQQKSEIDRKIGQLEYEQKNIEKQLKEQKVEQSKLENQADKAKLTQKRVEACESLEEAMKEILTIREGLVKNELQEKINKVYNQFLRKEYSIELSNSYELQVINGKGNIVGMSQGERQITSLSFIGAIVDIAREQYKKEAKSEFDEGGIYPIVMDSPFGALDSDHRERVGKNIYKLADQLIVIVSTSQWRGEVEGQMSNLIGKEYKLVYNDPRTNKDKPYEYTAVQEVK
ncbi:AAA family ATPase [Gottfriedia acidiceleris]|uniref:AAA family ATPase n=1 Tax=Gottfriedia acidiceleris TaxID=371036 RepID=UPI002FFE3B12